MIALKAAGAWVKARSGSLVIIFYTASVAGAFFYGIHLAENSAVNNFMEAENRYLKANSIVTARIRSEMQAETAKSSAIVASLRARLEEGESERDDLREELSGVNTECISPPAVFGLLQYAVCNTRNEDCRVPD